MSINNLQTHNGYDGPVKSLTELIPHGFGVQRITVGKLMNIYKGNFKNGNR